MGVFEQGELILQDGEEWLLVLRGMTNCQLVVTINSTRKYECASQNFIVSSLVSPVICMATSSHSRDGTETRTWDCYRWGLKKLTHKLGELTDEEMLRMKDECSFI